jgi:hypothetical protein
MTPEELNDGVRFTVDGNNHVTAVVLTLDMWRKVLAALEEGEQHELVALLKERSPAVVDLSELRLPELSEDWA